MQLSYSKTWDDMTALFRAHAELLLAIAGVFLFLPAVASGYLVPDPVITATDVMGQITQLFQHAQSYRLRTFAISIPAALGQVAILVLVLAADRPTVGEALKRGALLLVSFIVLNNILISLSFALGLILLVLPGIYIFGRLVPASAAMAAERVYNPLTAYMRGFAVSRGNGWRIAGIVVIVIVVAFVVTSAATSVVGVAVTLLGSADAARTANIFVEAALSAVAGVILLLLTAAIYRQLAGAQPVVSLSKGI